MKKAFKLLTQISLSLLLLCALKMNVYAQDGPNSKDFGVLNENVPVSTDVVTNLKFNQNPPDIYRFSIPRSGQVTITVESKVFNVRGYLYDNYDSVLYANDSNYDNYFDVEQSETKSVTYSLNKGSYYFSINDRSWEMAARGDAKYRIQSLSFRPSDEDFEEEQDGKNDNIISFANEITPGMDVTGMLATGETKDYYKLSLPQSGRVRFVVRSTDMTKFKLSILSNDNTAIMQREVVRPQGVAATTFNESLDLIGGNYYICIEQELLGAGRGLYTLSNTFNPANETDTVIESSDAMNDSLETASGIESGKEYYAQLALNEKCDIYEFAVINKGKTHLYINGDMEALEASILNASGNSIWNTRNSISAGVNVIDKDIVPDLETGTYYLKVAKDYETATGNYKFKLTLPARQNQKGDVLADAKGNVYKVTSATTVTYVRPKNNALTSVKVPDTVTLNGVNYKVSAIGNKAFYNNRKLTSVTIGKNVSTIGTSAFEGAVKLKKSDLSKTKVTVINAKAYKGCRALTEIKLNGNKVKTIKSTSLKTGNKKTVITVLAKDKKTFNSVVTKAVKAGAVKKNCKFKKSSK